MGERRGIFRLLVGKPEGKRPLGRPRRRWEDNIVMDLQEVGCGGMDWIELPQDRYEVCPKSKCTDFLFKYLLDSPEITSYLLQSVTLGKLHNGSNVFSTDHNSTGSYFP